MRTSPMRILLSPDSLSVVNGLLIAICYLGFASLHIWTIVVACRVYGLGAAIVSAALLGFAEVYWAFAFWATYGFWNYYTLLVVACVAVFGLISLLDRFPKDEATEEIKH